jgi:zinc transporter 1/2/3
MIVLGGYLLIFFVEKVAFDAHGLMHDCGDDHHDHGTDTGTGDGKEVAVVKEATNGRSAVILLGALAVHSILEMTALGLADSFGDSALLSLSIALHQVSLLNGASII